MRSFFSNDLVGSTGHLVKVRTGVKVWRVCFFCQQNNGMKVSLTEEGVNVGRCQATYLKLEGVISVFTMLPAEMLDQFPKACLSQDQLNDGKKI